MIGLTAWVDESGSNRAVDPGTYILSAAICDRSHAPQIREVMRALLIRKGGKLHWRDEGRRRQEQIAKTIANLNVEHLVVVRTDAVAVGSERQRRLCLERMFIELVALGVGTVVFQSRGPKDDQRDRHTLDHLRRRRMIASSLHLDHAGGRNEPMLWIADACCGAVTQLRCGDGLHYSVIESKVTMIDC